jgi:hypothetical protein
MYNEISHSTHFIPRYFRVIGTDVIRNMGGGFTDNDKIANNRIDRFSIAGKSSKRIPLV